jgi:2-oxoglutarate dehydrogenase E2 component (dihydrolipoamide succinyltransferase)
MVNYALPLAGALAVFLAAGAARAEAIEPATSAVAVATPAAAPLPAPAPVAPAAIVETAAPRAPVKPAEPAAHPARPAHASVCRPVAHVMRRPASRVAPTASLRPHAEPLLLARGFPIIFGVGY